MATSGCGVCGGGTAQQHENLAAWFGKAKQNPSDFHEHMETLRDLAAKCTHVTQIGIWGTPSRIALAIGTRGKFIDYSSAQRPEWSELKQFMNDRFEGKELPANGLEIEETELLFIDTYHNEVETFNLLTKHSPKVQKYLVIHTTEIFGETGDDGGPGVLPGLRLFVQANRVWTTIRQDRNNYGLLVLSRLDEDKKSPPGLLRKALNFTKALAAHASAGHKLVDDDTFNARLDTCLLCSERAHDICSKCGCPIDNKASWAEQQCPADPPKWPMVVD